MPERILLPLDGSDFAEQALPVAVGLARSAGATLHIVCVRGSLPLDLEGLERSYLDGIVGRVRPELPAVVAAVLRGPGPIQYPPRVAEITAPPIASYARARAVDIIVMATHARGGVRGDSLGSVADVLVRTAPCPVLLIRPRGEGASGRVAVRGMKHIVVAVDGTEPVQELAADALDLGRPFGARYSLVHVVSPITLPAGPPLTAIREAARGHLERLAAVMRLHGAMAATIVLDALVPAVAITRYAKFSKADAIVVATRGPAPPERLLLGSVAAEVVRGSPVPVLVCRIGRTGSALSRAAIVSGGPEWPA